MFARRVCYTLKSFSQVRGKTNAKKITILFETLFTHEVLIVCGGAILAFKCNNRGHVMVPRHKFYQIKLPMRSDGVILHRTMSITSRAISSRGV